MNIVITLRNLNLNVDILRFNILYFTYILLDYIHLTVLLVSFNLYLYLILKYSQLIMNSVLLQSDVLALGREYRV